MPTPASDPAPAPTPLASLARHWMASSLVMGLGLLVGVGVALGAPATYRAQCRVAVTPTSTSAYVLPGYPLGARELASDYARWVDNRVGSGDSPTAGGAQVSASPVPDTSVILVEASADSAAAAVAAAAGATAGLRAEVARSLDQRSPASALKQFQALQPQVAQAQTAADLAQAALNSSIGGKASAATVRAQTVAVEKARNTLAELHLKQSANGDLYRRLYSDTQGNSTLTVVAPAAATGDNRNALLARFGLVGLGLGYLVAQVVAVARDRRSARAA